MAMVITRERFTLHASSFAVLRTRVGALFVFGIMLFGAMLLMWGGVHGLVLVVHRNTVVLDADRFAVERSRLPEVEEALLATIARTGFIEEILVFQRDGAEPIRFLQERVQPNVAFVEVSVDYEAPSVTVMVRASTLTALAQQVAAFEEDSRVSKISVGELTRSLESGSVKGEVTVWFTDTALRAHPSP